MGIFFKSKEEQAFDKKVKFIENKKKVDTFCTTCENKVSECEAKIVELDKKALDALAAGAERNARRFAERLASKRRELDFLDAILSRADKIQMNLEAADSLNCMNELMGEMKTLMDISFTPNMNNSELDKMLEKMDARLEAMFPDAAVNTITPGGQAELDRLKEQLEKNAALDTIGATVAEVPFSTLKSDNNTKIGE